MTALLARLHSLPGAFLLAQGPKRWALAFAAGAFAVLALPPYGHLAALFVSLPVLVWLLDGAAGASGRLSGGRRLRAGFAIGWWFGFGYFLAGLWWIGLAFLVEADRFAWMIPFAVTLLPAGLALFHGLALALATRFWPERWTRIAVLAGMLSLSDWLRGHVLTGFPWNAFGYATAEILPLAQLGSLFGVYGTGALLLVLAAAPGLLVDGRRSGVAGLALALCGVGTAFVWGQVRLNGTEGLVDPTISVRVIQPSIAQSEKWKPENRLPIFRSYLGLSSSARGDADLPATRRVYVWPESAFPFLLTQEPEAIAEIDGLLEKDEILITGAIRAERNPDGVNYYNSIYVISDGGTIVDAYDKVRLVPFGEYLPLADVLETLGLRALVNAPNPFRAGYAHTVLGSGGLPAFLPLICYEVIFPQVPGEVGSRPKWLVNLTNDAWFGDTAGPYQHFAQARFRAIEQGLPLVRSANTGISAVVDAYGRPVEILAPFVTGAIETALPAALEPTVYARYGDLSYLAILLIFTAIFTLGRFNLSSRHN
ncbi:apolipoprotein N-acyltransferase [Microvirga tunisiensis]|uniref:Apolipoprotein N-acyltransferase n=2 Tax=Pannonibacter tanglangensis TaxID=2750084 RepID=A0ABW9ZM07_9HYPH|nr:MULTISPECIES: apolipoprotein N-acyltransferase [unclassified Pannonibacter]NBN65748.1 apolipoprotein N-acyltransferase [Pannonibacter sp. XCT-34]NBN80025.1 apolipoprotein N-acyltransferase [Pannonibacter sp. XCT-53]